MSVPYSRGWYSTIPLCFMKSVIQFRTKTVLKWKLYFTFVFLFSRFLAFLDLISYEPCTLIGYAAMYRCLFWRLLTEGYHPLPCCPLHTALTLISQLAEISTWGQCIWYVSKFDLFVNSSVALECLFVIINQNNRKKLLIVTGLPFCGGGVFLTILWLTKNRQEFWNLGLAVFCNEISLLVFIIPSFRRWCDWLK